MSMIKIKVAQMSRFFMQYAQNVKKITKFFDRPPTNAAAGVRENFNNAKFWKRFNELKY